MAEGTSGWYWMEAAKDTEAACCHFSGDKYIVGWVKVVFPGAMKLGAVAKPFPQGNSQFPSEWVAPELLGFSPGRLCLGTGWPRLVE
jgi:hypothetical protein